MKFDFLNISIIREFYNIKNGETPELAKIRDKIYPKLKKAEKTKYLCKIRDRLQSMPSDLFNIAKIEKEKTIEWRYHLKSENVCFNEFLFPDVKKEGMAIKISGRWQIIEL